MRRKAAAAWLLAGIGGVLACVLIEVELEGAGVLLGLVPVALVLATGLVAGPWPGAVATMVAYSGVAIYLGVTHPSTGLCLFDCDGVPITFGNTFGPVWVLGAFLAVVAAFGGVLRTRYWRAAILVVCVLLSLLGFGFIALAPERWHEAEGLLVPMAFVWSCVFLGLEARRLHRDGAAPSRNASPRGDSR